MPLRHPEADGTGGALVVGIEIRNGGTEWNYRRQPVHGPGRVVQAERAKRLVLALPANPVRCQYHAPRQFALDANRGLIGARLRIMRRKDVDSALEKLDAGDAVRAFGRRVTEKVGFQHRYLLIQDLDEIAQCDRTQRIQRKRSTNGKGLDALGGLLIHIGENIRERIRSDRNSTVSGRSSCRGRLELVPDGYGVPVDTASASNNRLPVFPNCPGKSDLRRKVFLVGLGGAEPIGNSPGLPFQDRSKILRQRNI